MQWRDTISNISVRTFWKTITKDHADITLNVLRENPKLRKLFEEKYV